MDQVKDILKQVAKYHFWILSLVAIIAAITGWFMASKALTAVYNQQKSTITGKFTALTGIQSTQDPPNATWAEEVDKLTAEQKQSVSTAWAKVYDEQKGVLKWPVDILGEDFVKAVESHAPDWDIDYDSITVYSRKIHEAFPKLLKIVDAASVQELKGSQDKATATETRDHSLIWAIASQTDVLESIEWKQVPTSAEVRRAQEDLWVYEALLRIIAAVNGGRTYGPRIKELTAIEIGKPAAEAFGEGLKSGHISEARLASAGPGQPGMGGDAPPPQPQGEPAAEGAGGPRRDDGRYVDADGKPQSSTDAAQKPYKRMPVSLHVVMDQRELPNLLAEFANSPLPVEVKQLRINPKSTGKKSTGSTNSSSGNKAAVNKSDTNTFELPVEILGIIYIYNKPPTEAAPAGGAAPAAPAG